MKINNYPKRHSWPFAQPEDLVATGTINSFGLHCLSVARPMQPCSEVASYVTIKK